MIEEPLYADILCVYVSHDYMNMDIIISDRFANYIEYIDIFMIIKNPIIPYPHIESMKKPETGASYKIYTESEYVVDSAKVKRGYSKKWNTDQGSALMAVYVNLNEKDKLKLKMLLE